MDYSISYIMEVNTSTKHIHHKFYIPDVSLVEKEVTKTKTIMTMLKMRFQARQLKTKVS